jgi:hypothetical protein
MILAKHSTVKITMKMTCKYVKETVEGDRFLAKHSTVKIIMKMTCSMLKRQ